MIRGLEAFVGDDDLFGRSLRGGGNLEKGNLPDDAFGLLLSGGKKGRVRTGVRGAEGPLFDYASELAGAKAAEGELRKSLGLGPRAER
jgi:hypothetical protein